MSREEAIKLLKTAVDLQDTKAVWSYIDQALALFKQPVCETCGGLKIVCKDGIGLAFGGVAAPCPDCQQPPAGELDNVAIQRIQRDHLEPDKLLCHLHWYRKQTTCDLLDQQARSLGSANRRIVRLSRTIVEQAERIKKMYAGDLSPESRLNGYSVITKALQEKIKQLKAALKLAYEAMNYLGNILNKHDMVQSEDEAVTKEAFEVVSKIVGKAKPSK